MDRGYDKRPQSQVGMCSLSSSNAATEHLGGYRGYGVAISTELVTALEKKYPMRGRRCFTELVPLIEECFAITVGPVALHRTCHDARKGTPREGEEAFHQTYASCIEVLF